MRMTGLLFSKGKRVEVSLEKVENCDVWFPAVVEEEAGNDCFLVEYQCLGKNGVPESVRVKVDFLHIRPSPPQFVKNYDLLEKVDAYIDFGWWSGVITKELPDSKYLIFFKQKNERRTVNQSDIRPHMEWKEGNWFSSSQDLLTSPEYQGPAESAAALSGGLGTLKENSAKRAANFFNSLDIRSEWLAPSSIEPSKVLTSQRKKTKLLCPNTDEQAIMMKQASVSDLRLLSTELLSSSPVRTPGEEIQFGCATLTDGGSRTNNSEQSMGDQLLDKLPRTRRKRARSKVKRYKSVQLKSTQYSPRRSAGRPQKPPTGETRASAGDKIVSELDNQTPELSVKNDEMLPIAQLSGRTSGDKKHDLRCIKENTVEEMVEPSVDREQQLHDPAVNLTKEDDQLEGHKERIGKRRGRRPRKFAKNLGGSRENEDKKLEKIPEVSQQNEGKKLEKSPEISPPNEGVVPADVDLEVALPVVVVGLEAAQVHGSVSNEGKLGIDKIILNGSADPKNKLSAKIEVYPVGKVKLQSRNVVQASVEHHEKGLSEGGLRRSIRINSKSPNQDPKEGRVGLSKANGKNSFGKKSETSLTFDLSDDQPLSMWMGSPKAANATCASRGMNLEPCIENRSPKDDVTISPQSNDESLPFVKSSSLWKTIESMEVFCQLPQRPHFQSLGSRKESSREGLAIALMVDFAGVVEKTSTLQFDDPRSTIEDNLETLIELEKNGFDVKVIRDRLLSLLLIKDKQEELQGNSKETTDQIKEKNHDKVKIDEKIEEIDNQIRLLQEERTLILSTKEENDLSIASLEVTLNDISSIIKNVNLEFETLVAAPWQGG
ncbi:hypothetical protein POM88_022763 [Heracleum sosnowskyi]|uniref:Agenet domain-containing protein n=1 Tax=Heracleum sosnowskyi TaxID=360622 RepID=A0AAD8IH03_9APIA|nr:hypothetical protein POM88_022763 [Heracleum sosnowskyi]